MGHTVHPSVWGTALLLVAIEAVFQAGDAGLVPPLREIAYMHLAVGAVPLGAALHVPGAAPWFVAGLAGHALLHAGWLHVAFNTVGLLCLGHVVQAQAGTAVYFLTFFLTAIAGALLFLLIAGGHGIMVGASGAVFGLLGVVLRWRSWRVPLWRVLVVLALLSLPAGLLFPGPIAWEAHLGGFLAGWGLGRVFRPKRLIRHPLM